MARKTIELKIKRQDSPTAASRSPGPFRPARYASTAGPATCPA